MFGLGFKIFLPYVDYFYSKIMSKTPRSFFLVMQLTRSFFFFFFYFYFT